MGADFAEHTLTFEPGNYDGNSFATALATKLNTAIAGAAIVVLFNCVYDTKENRLTLSLVDGRANKFPPFVLRILADEELKSNNKDVNTINTIIRTDLLTIVEETAPYSCYLDLFNTRNLYLTSSALCSYDTVSNFGMDTIIKKIPCTAPYNRMIFQSSGSTLDGLDVSKRTLRSLDFKLVDSSFRPVDLQENHFSFSIVFAQKR
jgi:hypothetical protein